MSEYMPLLLMTLQELIFSSLFKESLTISCKNTIEIKVKPNDFFEIQHYREIEQNISNNESFEINKVVETLVIKSQSLPKKRKNNGTQDTIKKNKRETIKVFKEELPVYKTMQFIDESPVVPIFSREETMPRHINSINRPTESN